MSDKNEIRLKVWQRLEEEKLGRFPFPLKGRIPNFKGAEKAAAFVFEMPEYKHADVIKVNPDAPQLPLRAQVLKDGKTLLVPTPRLKAGFMQVKPEWVPAGEERRAASLSHIKEYGQLLPLSELPRIDLIVIGSVAMTKDGRRLGKGEGYADREYAIIRELGNPEVPVITTVNSRQLVEDDIPVEEFDLTADWIATEKGLTRTESRVPKPKGIVWSRVTDEDMASMPVLQEIKDLNSKKNPL
ncbi:5-formyltetrahydrofolate cyclo-ligase [Metabacillus sp. KIGAM252]|uniref:5-formyltetrahydrofolate cyclo-ligase n=1 Tax=Metabacillus flavus TaxID=2823519 RepID=A0ABS5LB88_9BACI|nr:5-formyltetrahydrofolate cyclo-ligase [Metabacillus flavus]MBS2967729.1 5-formyltetrahydrofolate cyclo-ligase [Metabacillus flavus]